MTTLDSSKETKKNDSQSSEHHEDFRMFGLITFLIGLQPYGVGKYLSIVQCYSHVDLL